MARKRTNPAILLVTVLAAGLAGCGQATAPTGAPETPATTSSAAAEATVAATSVATEKAPPALDLLWEGRGPTEIKGWYPGTYQPAVDPLTGDVWVALSSEHLIWIFSKEGEFQGVFGGPGDGPGEFDFRRPACRDCPGAGALTFAPDGSLFVADVGHHRVQKFDPEHKFEKQWGGFGAGEGQFADAIGIATNGREVFVGDGERGDTQVFDMSGTYLRTLTGGWLAVDPAGGLSISSFGTVTRYDADGKQLDPVSLPAQGNDELIGLAVDDDGRVFFDYQDAREPHGAVALGEVDPTTGNSRTWSTAGETLAISGNVLYEANYTGEGWPEPVLRAYVLPAP